MFSMAQHHKYSIKELEEMMPYERDLYFELLLDYVKQEQEKNRK